MYTVTHLHSDYGNGIFIDSTTKYKQYIDYAASIGMKAIAFTEHGSVLSWVNKKNYCDKQGIKYIHGEEFYVTETLSEKIKDNYHCCLYAKNWNGVKELNKLSSAAFNRQDGHFYYVPRISIDELINTSDNIMVATACLGSILNKGNDNIKNRFIEFLQANAGRCFLEIQHHNIKEQIIYNQYLYKLSNDINVPLIIGTDTHSLNQELHEARHILQLSKHIELDDTLDPTFKTYDELIEAYKIQNSLPINVVIEALNNTNALADRVEPFELDTNPKYPVLFANSDEVFRNEINKGFVNRGCTMLPDETRQQYIDRVRYEYDVYKTNGAIDYMLLQKDIVDFCHKNNIYPGPSRGSVSGSLIAYLLGITEMDSIKWNLNFERFMHNERVSLADIDVDYPPSQRETVKQYIFNKPELYCCDIITHNTLALKGAIRDVGRALNMPLNTVNAICDNVEAKEDYYREKYPELFHYVDLLQGVIVSVGSHPCGSVVSPVSLDDNIGLCTTSANDYFVSQIDMKEIDGLNFVKLDLLGLDNIEIINKTCELAGINRLTPDNIDVEDIDVWNSIAENNLGIFQMESSFAADYIKRLFNPETIAKIKQQSPNMRYIDLFAMANGALRPGGASYRDKLANGEFNDNGHPILNEFFSDTMGFCTYQEGLLAFLHKFCGFTMGQADMVRRGLAKKIGTEEFIPQIKDGFIKTMQEQYNVQPEQSGKLIESFLQVVLDSADYLFSYNHSLPYSFIGYMCGYLRYYYPLEFLTTMLNINTGNQDKTAEIIKYANEHNITINPVQFRHSQAGYSYDKATNTIYKGMASIKFLNAQIAGELYELRNNSYDSFTDLLVDIAEKTSCDTRQVQILITLNFFSEFGKNAKLLEIYKKFTERYKKTYIQTTKAKRIAEIKEYELSLPDTGLKVREQIVYEQEYLGYIQATYPLIDPNYVVVLNIDTKYTPKLTVRVLNTGEEKMYKIYKNLFKDINQYDVLYIAKTISKPRVIKGEDGKWIEIGGYDEYVMDYIKQ